MKHCFIKLDACTKHLFVNPIAITFTLFLCADILDDLKVSGVNVNCSPLNLIVQCTTVWNVS